MEYTGIQAQQRRNNVRSLALLVLFPVLVAALTFAFCWVVFSVNSYPDGVQPLDRGWAMFVEALPWVMGAVGLWFVIAYFANTSIIGRATGAHTLERRDNMRVYNIVENLCMSQGMPMPKVEVIEDASLNAYASGINKKSYTVTLTRGIIERLDDNELEGVVAHELSHIRNNDVRLLVVSIVFVGIFTMVSQIALRTMLYSRPQGGKDKGGGMAAILLLLAVLAAVGWFFATMMRFAISRKREYLADAGAAEMTRNPGALASALRRISADPDVESVRRNDVAQLFIHHPLGGKRRGGIFASHPPIERRIEALEQF